MPEYLVTDPATGRRYRFSGPTVPSPGVIRQALAQQQVAPVASHAPTITEPQAAWQKAETIGPPKAAPSTWQDNKAGYLLEHGMDLARGLVTGDAPLGPTTQGVGALLAAGLPLVGGGKFFSRLTQAAARLPEQKLPAKKVLQLLESGSTAEEVEARGLREFLAAQKGSVPKADVLAHLEAHPVPQVQVKTLGEPPADLVARQQDLSAQASIAFDRAFPSATTGFQGDLRVDWAWKAAGGDPEAIAKLNQLTISPERRTAILEYGRLANEMRVLNEQRLSGFPSPKFAQWQVPGGQDYRETLITLPVKQEEGPAQSLTMRAFKLAEASGDDWDRLGPNGRQRYIEQAQRQTAGVYRSSHFDEPNILVHTRSTTREAPGLGRGTFLEEIQSDWHQAGKEKGYGAAITPDLRRGLESEAASIQARLTALDQQYTRGLQPGADYLRDHPSLGASREFATLRERRAAINRQLWQPDRVPDAPFKDTWPDLALKHHLVEAAQDPDVHWLGFTSGETQAARYDLSQHIQQIDYRRHGPPTDEGWFTLGAVDRQGQPVELPKATVTAEELPQIVGKEIAKKIIDGEGTPGGGRMTLSGLDLRVGGEGMHQWYDESYRNKLQKLVKPFGGTVERVPVQQFPDPKAVRDARIKELIARRDGLQAELSAGGPGPAPQHLRTMLRNTNMQIEMVMREATERVSEEAAKHGADATGTVWGWAVRLTPAIKAAILKAGLPLMTVGGLAVSHKQTD